MSPYHLVYFTPKTLKLCVETAGFDVVSIKSHESFSGWFLVVMRSLISTHNKNSSERLACRANRKASLTEHLYRIAMVATGVVLWPLRLIQGELGYGDEIVLIARKQN